MAPRGKKQSRKNFHATLRRRWRKDGTYDKLFKEQEGLCAICGKPPHEGKVFDLDHNHRSFVLRGLLHRGCNLRLRRGSSSAWFRQAADYLERNGE